MDAESGPGAARAVELAQQAAQTFGADLGLAPRRRPGSKTGSDAGAPLVHHLGGRFRNRTCHLYPSGHDRTFNHPAPGGAVCAQPVARVSTDSDRHVIDHLVDPASRAQTPHNALHARALRRVLRYLRPQRFGQNGAADPDVAPQRFASVSARTSCASAVCSCTSTAICWPARQSVTCMP